MNAVLGLLAVLVLTAGTGYFVAQEFAYVAADRLALAREAKAGDKRAARAVKVLERLSFMLSGAQLGITVTGLIVGFLAEPSVSALLRPALTGTGLSDGAVSAVSVTLAFVMATVVQMVLGATNRASCHAPTPNSSTTHWSSPSAPWTRSWCRASRSPTYAPTHLPPRSYS